MCENWKLLIVIFSANISRVNFNLFKKLSKKRNLSVSDLISSHNLLIYLSSHYFAKIFLAWKVSLWFFFIIKKIKLKIFGLFWYLCWIYAGFMLADLDILKSIVYVSMLICNYHPLDIGSYRLRFESVKNLTMPILNLVWSSRNPSSRNHILKFSYTNPETLTHVNCDF